MTLSNWLLMIYKYSIKFDLQMYILVAVLA